MIRTTLLWMFVAWVSAYAWRDWYKAACGLVLLMAVIQHPDMPKTLLGIQGLNPWNLALASTMAAWWVARKRENLTWDMPRHMVVLAGLYMFVMFVSFVRMIVDAEALHETNAYLVSEHLINVFKWVVPALMLFDGCRTRNRFVMAIGTILCLYLLLAGQVIRWVPLSFATSGEALAERSHKIIGKEIGYHRVNMSMMLAGASWAIFVAAVLVKGWGARLLIVASAVAVLLAQALTAGRTGYVTWFVVGLLLCMVRWKRYLVLTPALAVLLVTLVPGASERMLQGFTEDTVDTNSRLEAAAIETTADPFDGESGPDLYTVTSGRVIAWPFVIDKIWEQPLFGYGKQAMRRTGLTQFLMDELGEGFPHPHNAYLELLLDNGVIGFLCVIPFYLCLLWHSYSLFRDSRSPVFIVAGGVAASLILALMVASTGSQTFYPREGSVGMWAAIGLLLRISVERRQALARLAAADAAVPVPAQPAVVARQPTPAPRASVRMPPRPSEHRSTKPAARTRLRVRTAGPDETATTLDSILWRPAA